ncbi:Crp/Fnr family transcriptional regulator [Xylophilus sp. ASV27]|uniref:Crp/Fnr family transcriptional regulator n=1 Tax=Xylophilus sp. ASV27 TaxID=2795129 RepID=UPI0018EA9AFA|nr:Crp/Fnr family transcriptional regulator [Xylophilus sp. ASV27]
MGAPERDGLAALIQERPFHRSQVLQEQGQIATSLRIVKTGSTLMLRHSTDGRARGVGLAGRGYTFGKFALVDQPDALTCVGASSGRLCEIEFAAARSLGLLNRRVWWNLVHAHIREFGLLADWAQAMRVGGAPAQLWAALQLMATEQGSRCVRLPTQTVLAELLGTTRETVARSLRVLEQTQQLVRRDRWHCELSSVAM